MNFDEPIDRTSSGSSRWRKRGDTIALTIGDSDFRMAPAIREALEARVRHGVLGYDKVPTALVELIIGRLASEYGWRVEKDWLVFLPGIVSGLNFACRAYAGPGERVISETPVYYPFLAAPGNAGRELAGLPARRNGARWAFDQETFDDLAGRPDHSLLLLCNPQNPLGRVLDAGELALIAETCLRENVVICSDEIHCDLLFDGARHLPIATLSPEVADITITLMSPSKAFAISGLGGAFAIIPNDAMRRRFLGVSAGVIPNLNAMSLVAMQAAYGECGQWLSEALAYLKTNRDFLWAGLADLPGIDVTRPEATYFLWLDFRRSGLDDPWQSMLEAGVELSPGVPFGGPGFLRLNFASPASRLREALARIRGKLSR